MNVHLLRSVEKNGSKIDPPFRMQRKLGMLTEMTHLRPRSTSVLLAEGAIQIDPEQEHTCVPQSPRPEFTDQTRWMLAIRDQRDRVAFGKLFDYFAPRLKGVGMRSGMNGDLAEEVAQEVMLTVWRKAEQFDPHRAPVAAWIFQIARNKRIDVIRKENRPLPQEELVEVEAESDASQIMAMEQEGAQLRAALDTLKPDQRQMIEQAYLGELTHKEISDRTGLALGTVKSRIRLGLDRLRHELKGLR